jgi:hypothetical protein
MTVPAGGWLVRGTEAIERMVSRRRARVKKRRSTGGGGAARASEDGRVPWG